MANFETFCCYLSTLFPKVLSSTLYLWCCYVFCVEISLNRFQSGTLAAVGLLFTANGLYLYYLIVSRGPGYTREFVELHCYGSGQDDLEAQAAPPEFLVKNSITVKNNGNPRYCSKCNCWKPDRAHHCSSCQQCCLKMDHHCPWFACCIGFRNQKFFIQFLVNSIALALVGVLFASWDLYTFFAREQYNDAYLSVSVVVFWIFAVTVAIAVGVFTVFSVYLVAKNLTTIEYYELNRYKNNMELIRDSYYRYSSKPDTQTHGNVFDLGLGANLNEVLGASWAEWLLPIARTASTGPGAGPADTAIDQGLCYRVNRDIFRQLKENSHIQQQLLQQLSSHRG